MSYAQRVKKGNMQTHVSYNARKQIAAPKQQRLESEKEAEDWDTDAAPNFCLFRDATPAHSVLQEEHRKLRITHHKYEKATKAQISSLTQKLKETERKLNELQNCFLGTDNSEDTTILMAQLRESENKVKELEADKKHLKSTINDMTEEHRMLAMQFSDNNVVSARTINELKKQLEEARSPRNLQAQSSQPAAELSAEPSRQAMKASQANFRSAKEAALELKCGKQQAQIQHLQQQLRESQRQLEEQAAAELKAEPSHQATKDSQANFRSAEEAELELKCGKQEEQIQQLQQQLQQQVQESQRQLEEQAIQHRQEREKFQAETNEVKSLLAQYKDLHAFYLQAMNEEKEEKSSMGTQLEKTEAEKTPQTVEPLQKKQGMEQEKEGKVDLVPQTSLSVQEPAEEKQGMDQEKEGKVDLVPQTSLSVQEPAEEKQGTEQEKAGKGDSLLDAVRSLQETLKTNQGNENILVTKLEKLEEQPKQKKKCNWLLRLFSRNKS